MTASHTAPADGANRDPGWTVCPRCGAETVPHEDGAEAWRECSVCGLEIPLALSPYERREMLQKITEEQRHDV